MIKVKKAFSLIEVIFVLVILGIVASLTSQIIVQVYENYITQKAIYNTSTKTELVATQIVNRLTYAIEGTTIVKTTPFTGTTKGTDWIMLKDLTHAREIFTTLEWIGYDNDSYSAGQTPAWSGVANYETATRNSFSTPGSHLNDTALIMHNLSGGKVNLTSTKPAGLLFFQQSNDYITGENYNPRCMGLIENNNTSCIFPVMIGATDNNLTFTRNADANNANPLPKIVTERYKLAWSAYALVPEKQSDGQTDLFLYSNYQPWNGEKYSDNGVRKNLLMNDISVFKFTENGGVIQLKLCANESIGQDYNISSCKEKAIIK